MTQLPTSDEWGIQRDWIDADDLPQRVGETTLERVREAIGRPPADLEERAPIVTRRGRSTGLTGVVHCEDGTRRHLDDVVPDDLAFGYHTLVGESGPERRLIVSPGECWLPDEQVWGWNVQLYGALSTESTGVGDLADLRTLREWTEGQGGGFLLVNPLHAVAPVVPMESSPYLPATRRFRNPVYLRLEDVPGATDVLLTRRRATGSRARGGRPRRRLGPQGLGAAPGVRRPAGRPGVRRLAGRAGLGPGGVRRVVGAGRAARRRLPHLARRAARPPRSRGRRGHRRPGGRRDVPRLAAVAPRRTADRTRPAT